MAFFFNLFKRKPQVSQPKTQIELMDEHFKSEAEQIFEPISTKIQNVQLKLIEDNYFMAVSQTSEKDVKQGKLGDCGLVSTIFYLLKHKLIPDDSIQIDNETVRIKLYFNAEQKIVSMSKQVVVAENKNDPKELIYMGCSLKDSGIPLILEKGIAVAEGSYISLRGKSTGDSIIELCGYSPFKTDYKEMKKNHPNLTIDDYFEHILTYFNSGWLIIMLTSDQIQGTEIEGSKKKRVKNICLLPSHAYPIVNVEKVINQNTELHLITLYDIHRKDDNNNVWEPSGINDIDKTNLDYINTGEIKCEFNDIFNSIEVLITSNIPQSIRQKQPIFAKFQDYTEFTNYQTIVKEPFDIILFFDIQEIEHFKNFIKSNEVEIGLYAITGGQEKQLKSIDFKKLDMKYKCFHRSYTFLKQYPIKMKMTSRKQPFNFDIFKIRINMMYRPI